MKRHLTIRGRLLVLAGGLLVLLAIVTSWGCASVSPPIQIEASAADYSALIGEWIGEYEGTGPRGRSGSILFTLAAGEDHAHGDVLMTPAGSPHGYARYPGLDPTGRRDAVPPPREMLTIHFVRVNGRVVSGTLDPYWDPDRECWAATTFVGALFEHTITGTFRTSFSSGAFEEKGRWEVKKVPARSGR